jgi:hypothetical protein
LIGEGRAERRPRQAGLAFDGPINRWVVPFFSSREGDWGRRQVRWP